MHCRCRKQANGQTGNFMCSWQRAKLCLQPANLPEARPFMKPLPMLLKIQCISLILISPCCHSCTQTKNLSRVCYTLSITFPLEISELTLKQGVTPYPRLLKICTVNYENESHVMISCTFCNDAPNFMMNLLNITSLKTSMSILKFCSHRPLYLYIL